MATEIERKFLVVSDDWNADVTSRHSLRDGIAPFGKGKVRIRTDGNRAWVTFKGPRAGITRREFEYEIPQHEAEEMLDTLCPATLVLKVRHLVPVNGMVWAVDVHEQPFSGLTTAEVELCNEGQVIELPSWVGREVRGRVSCLISELASLPQAGNAFGWPSKAPDSLPAE